MDKKAMMEKLAREAYEKDCFNGTWLYAENGEIVSKGALGWRDAENTLPMQEDSIFELASVSKQFTAAAIMLLYKRGLLRFEDELSKFFPENPYEGVTVSHLLHHTSGIPDHEDWATENLKDEKEIPKNDLCVRFLRESGLEPEFAPGEKWEYSNTAYCLLAEIVAKVSGMPFEAFMQKEIFEPCGMLSTRVCHIRVDGIPFDNFARGLVFYDGEYRIPDELEDYHEVILLDGECGVGFVYTNIFDMFRWDRALREETLFTKEDQATMFTPGRLNNGEIATDDEGNGYGFGWFISEDPALGRILSHSGGWPGYATWCERCVDTDRMLVFLCCREPEDIRGIDGFFEGMSKIARDKEPAPIRTIEDLAVKDPDKSKWESFCGKYEKQDEDFPIEEVYSKDGELYAKVAYEEDDVCDYRLYPIGEDTFGRKGGMVKITFGEDCLVINGKTTCKKL